LVIRLLIQIVFQPTDGTNTVVGIDEIVLKQGNLGFLFDVRIKSVSYHV